jgi:acetylornithine deacetylase
VNPPRSTDILRELVAIPTQSSVTNILLLQWVAAYLEPLGWQIEWLRYIDDAGIEKANMIARPKGLFNSQIDLAFLCHTDTVPYAANWPDALRLDQRDGYLHGCGSCDVKGALACFLAAVSAIASDVLRPGIALMLTADEEIGCKGMERLLAATNLHIASAIVSEPTSLRPGIAGKGYGLARITVQGREAHSAFPNKGVSAISIAVRLIASIEDKFKHEQTDSLFDPPHTTLNIGVIEGGTAKNIVPGRCSFLVEWRAIPSDHPGNIVQHLQAVIAEAQSANPRAEILFEALRAEPGFSPSLSGPLQLHLAGLLSRHPVGISFGSEASRVAHIAREVIVIGPGDMQTAHSNRECVPIAELDLWTATLQSLLSK